MGEARTVASLNPVVSDPELVECRSQCDEKSLLDEILRSGAHQTLQVAVDVEVAVLDQTENVAGP